jgi:ATP-dependent DNA helicase Q4
MYKAIKAKNEKVPVINKNNAYYNKNRRGKWKRKGGKKMEELDEFGQKLRKERAEKSGNFVRQDLRKKYEARLHGMAYIYKKHYMANGRSKAFYKNLPENESLQTDPKNHKEVEEEFMYKSKFKFDAIKEGALSEENSIITKDNVFFKMINKGMGFLMMSRSMVPANQVELFDRNILDLYQQKDFLGADVPAENTEISLNVTEAVQGAKENFKWRTTLKSIFGHENFYDFQREVLNTCYEGKSSLVDFYTGAGKSLIFQFYSILKPGMTIVLVPLISLMIDQIKKIPEEIPAICYNSWVPFTHRPRVFNLIKNNKVKILFVTPELFVSDIAWRLIMYKTKINLICIDEAHCVSESSHSFRHSYSFLKHYVKLLNNTGSIQMGAEYFDYKEEDLKEEKKEEKKGKKGRKKKGKKGAKKDTKKVKEMDKTLDGLKTDDVTEEDLDMFAARENDEKESVKPITTEEEP